MSQQMSPPNFVQLMVYKEPDLNKAAVMGYSARRGGRAQGDNPYPVASFRGAVWENGWIIADIELKGQATPQVKGVVEKCRRTGLTWAGQAFAPGAIEHHTRRVTWSRRLLVLFLTVLAAAASGWFLAWLEAPKVLAGVIGALIGVLGVKEALK